MPSATGAYSYQASRSITAMAGGAGGANSRARLSARQLAGAHRLVAVNAGSDEYGIDSSRFRALKVGTQAIADGDDACPRHGGASHPLGHSSRRLVGVDVWLSGPEHRPVHALVEVGNGAGTEELLAAHVDDEVRVGTDERQIARACLLEQRAIVVGRLVDVIVEARAQDGVGLIDAATRSAVSRENVAASRSPGPMQ